ncbi:MAG TPA: FAD-dependent monooxygenase [Pyrinomonadaceae bacterium]|jgi:2-polyprenyl-6-methoxyphenol hydroxylase-like FAD-dependent oxidoreductase|nr:FAD-dependent monooxygenase [Pyrinomonadaceae bacterium]
MNTRGNRQVGSKARSGRHAVVLGGSLAGLLAARVLSDHFDEVTLIERDAYPETTAARKGIPQANHVHGLLARGREILEELFPGVQDEMIAAGAPVVDIANEIAWFTPAGWGVRFPSELMILAFTRPLLDLHVRRRLAENPRVRVLDNTDVLRLIPDAKTKHLAGVLICPRASETDRRVATELCADLVLDATGRASRAPRWLKDLGYEPPEEIVIDAHLAYASRLFRIPEYFAGDWHCAYVQAAPPDQKRGAILFKVEDNRWLVTLIGRGGDTPPDDEAGFLEFARTLRVSTIFDAIRCAEPIAPIKTHRATQNRLRRYERADLPENFVLLGDAVCAFNPIYGQGMTTAALGAMELGQCLRESKGSLNNLSRRFQKRLAKINAAPWLMAIGEDYRYRETVGGSPTLMTRFMHRYMDQVVQLATRSVPVRRVLLRAFNMLVPPMALFHPKVLFRVVLNLLKPARRQQRALSHESESALGRGQYHHAVASGSGERRLKAEV